MEVVPETADVHTTLEYRLDAELADWLPIGVLTIFCGLFIFAVDMTGSARSCTSGWEKQRKELDNLMRRAFGP